MAQTLSNVLLHLVFSTKGRKKIILPEIESDLHKYMCTILKNQKSIVHQIGGTDDHVHILFSISRNIAIGKLVNELKSNSSRWVKTQGNKYSLFGWQNGYGIFSIGQSAFHNLVKYIANQKEHHKKMSFEEEFVILLKKYDIKYDEKYLWD